MTRIRRVWVAEEFADLLQVKAIKAGYAQVVPFTKDLAARELLPFPDVMNRKKRKQKNVFEL